MLNNLDVNSGVSTEKSEDIQVFNTEKQKQDIELQLRDSPEVRIIENQIDLAKPDTIMGFGANTAQEIASFSDGILRSVEASKTDDSGKMLDQLSKIMSKFDIADFKDKPDSALEKFFNKIKDPVQALMSKYHTLGDDVDKIFITLKQYEAEIHKNNESLEQMFGKNLEYYTQLKKYICAGEMAVEELQTKVLPMYETKAQTSGQQIDQVNYNNVKQIAEMMEQRVYDLRLAENVALQSMPMIKAIQYGNYNLVRKINSAFIITLPIFKQCLAQAIFLKRQSIQAKAISALDETTNKLILQNAKNTAMQTTMTAKLATGSFVEVETLETSWNTIMNGINETKQIQEQAKQKRETDTQRLASLKQQYESAKLGK